MKTEFNFKKGKRGAVVAKDAKVMKSIRIDLDVLTWLQVEGERRGIPYQTLINSLLKEAMGGQEEKIRKIVQDELAKRSA